MHRRWLRFRLSTLLLAMTAFAVLLWGAPQFRAYRQRMETEYILRQLKAGARPDLRKSLPAHAWEKSPDSIYLLFDETHTNVVAHVAPICYDDWWYCIYTRNAPCKGASSQVRVYRLPARPVDYQRSTLRSRGAPGRKSRNPSLVSVVLDYRSKDALYLDEAVGVISGRVTNVSGIEWEPIHEDALPTGQSGSLLD